MIQQNAKSVGEMNGAEFDACLRASFGLRPPSDPAQEPAYLVTVAFILATRHCTDPDLVEAFVVNLLLGQGEALPGCRERIEKALKRPIGPNEPRPLDPAALLDEQRQRMQRAAAALFT